jgi:hypothetical protein
MLGKDLYKRDGSYYPLNIASRSVYTAPNEVAKTIAGTWFAPRTEFNSFLGGVRSWTVTDKGKAAMSTPADPKATTQKDCIPIGAPALMFYPVANTITVQKDRVVMKVDWMDNRAHGFPRRPQTSSRDRDVPARSLRGTMGRRHARGRYHELQRAPNGLVHVVCPAAPASI